MKIKIVKLDERAVVPAAGTGHSAGYDLCACMKEERTVIAPGSTKLIGTGLAAAIPEGYFGGVFARSGLSLKQGLRPANCVGVIDPDYRGEICVALHNDSGTERVIEQGERIAQLLILPFMKAEFEACESLDVTSRGEGGFGHTGLY
jgi:dUTP pyrophosphatase